MDFEVVAEGLQFPEGPMAAPDGSVILVEMRRRTLTRITPDGRAEVLTDLGGGPNGAAIGPEGVVYICNNGGRFNFGPRRTSAPAVAPPDHVGGSIQRLDMKTGAIETLYEACEGRRLLAPNDLVFDKTGGFWFTDHGRADESGLRYGALFYALADGSQIRCVSDYWISPNGVGLSPDERTVYMADTRTARVWAFALGAPGALADPSAPGRLLGGLLGNQLFDSLAVEAGGRVCVATVVDGGITVFDDSGPVEHHGFPDPLITNICFGGEDMRDAWITAAGTGRIFRCRWPRPGLRLNFS